ncbi:MAG: aminotransferase class V-fold PLP-dependent enzyme [Flavobacteriaceae bacterium]|nr:aminotransferase class V-fold PLP-dependent enzyme [Flavobacteriaceae bacterium]
MSTNLLKRAYDPGNFRQNGHQLVDLLSEHLQESLEGKKNKVIDYAVPSEELQFWKEYLEDGDSQQWPEQLLKHSIHLHNPRYMGHQISPPVPLTGLTALASAILNNGMGVYEMGAGPTVMERLVTDTLCETLGYPDDAAGFLTSGGTLATLTALLSARKRKVGHNVWENGLGPALAVMVSEEAHYCVDRAARIMGLGTEGILKVPVDKNFRINTTLLQEVYEKAEAKGMQVFALVGSAPSTATGVYDDLEALGQFAREKNLWFHVDGAHGGAAMFSAKYNYLLKGADQSDSIAIDGHKMMMMPAITTALLFRDKRDSHNTFVQKADYLLQDSPDEDWYNLAKRTFECTKYMMSLHWFVLLKTYGKDLFDEFVTTLYDLGHTLGQMVSEAPDFELAVAPMSNIVCFRYTGKGKDLTAQNALNSAIRRKILDSGKYYIVQTTLDGTFFLRTTLMNPFTTREDLQGLLSTIRSLGAEPAMS